jgi:two-component system, LytTR family, sensor kinase
MNVFKSLSQQKVLLAFLLTFCFLSLTTSLLLHRYYNNWQVVLIDAGVSSVLLSVLAVSQMLLMSNYSPAKNNYLIQFTIAATAAAMFNYIDGFILNHFIKESDYLQLIILSAPLRFVFALLVLAMVLLLISIRNKWEDAYQINLQQKKTQELAREAELASLRQKLKPHFLFNSLNSISALALSNPEEARVMIQNLSAFLRGTLKTEENVITDLEQELKQLHLYLSIEKVRFGHRLSINFEVDEKAHQAQLPSMILQPIVENAIKYGLYDTIGKTEIEIKIKLEEYALIINVSNPFDKNSHRISDGEGFGLNYIKRRLYLLYSRNDLLITNTNNDRFFTEMIIPQNKSEKCIKQ